MKESIKASLDDPWLRFTTLIFIATVSAVIEVLIGY